MNKKLLIGLGIAAVATTVIAVAVAHELKKIRKLTAEDELDADSEESTDD